MNKKTITLENNKKTHILSIVITCLAVFFALWLMVEMDHASLIDDPVNAVIYSLRSDWLTPIMEVITYIGNWQTVTALCLILLIIKKTRITYGIPLAIGAIVVTVVNNALKALVQRPRPDAAFHLIEQGGWSFPSGHSITSMFFFGMLIWLIRRNMQNRTAANVLTVLFAIPMVLIGVSRIYLGVHYPTDVLAGWCLGVATIAMMIAIVGRSK